MHDPMWTYASWYPVPDRIVWNQGIGHLQQNKSWMIVLSGLNIISHVEQLGTFVILGVHTCINLIPKRTTEKPE